jgi:hypothetical protein
VRGILPWPEYIITEENMSNIPHLNHSPYVHVT